MKGTQCFVNKSNIWNITYVLKCFLISPNLLHDTHIEFYQLIGKHLMYGCFLIIFVQVTPAIFPLIKNNNNFLRKVSELCTKNR